MATWRWDVNDERCGICYTAFEACCPDCAMPGDDCPPGAYADWTGNRAVIELAPLVWLCGWSPPNAKADPVDRSDAH